MFRRIEYNLYLDLAVLQEYLLVLMQFKNVYKDYREFVRNHTSYFFEDLNAHCDELMEGIYGVQGRIHIVMELFIELRRTNKILSMRNNIILNTYDGKIHCLKNNIGFAIKWGEKIEQIQSYHGYSGRS